MIDGLVSIVIPCYGGERFLGEAIESCLAQTYRAIEVIVVDDASPDRCRQIAEQYARDDPRVRVVRRWRNGGVSRAFNTGFRVARGEFFSRLAQDDRFREDAIELMVGYLRTHPEVGLVYCDMQRIDEQGNVLGVHETADPENALIDGDRVGLCVMWPRRVWEAIGQFDPLFDAAEDYEYWLRLAKRFILGKVAREAPFFVRFHSKMGSEVYSRKQVMAALLARQIHLGKGLDSGGPCSTYRGAATRQRCESLARIYWDASWIYQSADNYQAAAWCAWRAAIHCPCRPTYWKHAAGAAIRALGRALRRPEIQTRG